MSEENNSVNDKITLDIARKLASEGNYEEAIPLLSSLIHSEFSIEALNLLGKIYAQKQDFDSAKVYFDQVLQQDSSNVEAKKGLAKCHELKDSKFKTYLGFNKLKVYSIIAAVLVVACLLAAIGLGAMQSGGHNYSDGTVFADTDSISLSFSFDGDASVASSILKNDIGNSSKIKLSEKNGVVNVTADKDSIYQVLYALDYINSLNYTSVDVDSIAFSLSADSQNKAIGDANNVAAQKANLSNIAAIKNVSSTVVPNTVSFENVDGYSAQQQNIYFMLNNDVYSKVKVISVIEC